MNALAIESLLQFASDLRQDTISHSAMTGDTGLQGQRTDHSVHRSNSYDTGAGMSGLPSSEYIAEHLPNTNNFIIASILDNLNQSNTAVAVATSNESKASDGTSMDQLLQLLNGFSLPNNRQDIVNYFHENKTISSNKIEQLVFYRSLCLLFQSNINYSDFNSVLIHIPETMRYDVKKLILFKNDIDLIALVATITITTRQYVLNIKGLKSAALHSMKYQELNLINALDAALREDDVTLSKVYEVIKDYIRNIVFNSQLLVQGNGSSVTSNSVELELATKSANTLLADTWESDVESIIQKSIGPNSQILKLFTNRVYKILIRGLYGLPFLDLLANYSMNTKLQVLLMCNENHATVCVLRLSILYYYSKLFSDSVIVILLDSTIICCD
jgi:hypothetical protein